MRKAVLAAAAFTVLLLIVAVWTRGGRGEPATEPIRAGAANHGDRGAPLPSRGPSTTRSDVESPASGDEARPDPTEADGDREDRGPAERLPWEEARPLVESQARSLWKRDREFMKSVLVGPRPYDDPEQLRKLLGISRGSDVDLALAGRDLEEVLAEVDQRLDDLCVPYLSELDMAFEMALAAVGPRGPLGRRSPRRAEDGAGRHSVQVDAGGWSVEYTVYTTDRPELQRLAEEREDLVRERFRLIKEFRPRR